jgi:lauroyl/myristoyl acyltransferase
MENLRELSSFFAIRALERILPASGLYRILKSAALARAARHGLPRQSAPQTSLPEFFGNSAPVNSISRDLVRCHLNSQLEMFPDRLGTAKWMSRCRIARLDRVWLARQNGRPVVLAFTHFGTYYLLRYWLRAARVPVATIVEGKLEDRSRLKRLKDAKSLFPETPTAFHQDQLPQAIKFLRSGNPLLVAIDSTNGKQLEVPCHKGWNFEMATGALRLAIRHRAELMFCSMVEEGEWRFCIELGQPVPKEFLVDETDLIPAAKHLVNEMLVQYEKHPEQCLKKKLERFRRTSPSVSKPPVNESANSHQTVAR